MLTAVFACTAKFPKPKLVLPPAAVLEPVPPLATGNKPLTSDVKSIVPSKDAVPLENLTKPDPELKSCPVPPYVGAIAVAVQVPATTLPRRKSSNVEPLLAVRSNLVLLVSYLSLPPLFPN